MAYLDGAWWKVRRAEDQIREFTWTIQAYLDGKPFQLITESNSERTEGLVRFRITEHPKRIWAVQLGEIIHDLRSALDHAIWQMIRDNNQVPTDGVSGFPIFDSEDKFKKFGNEKTKGCPDEARAYIQRIQPYQVRNEGKDPRERPLWVLHDLWNTDKHRLLHLLTIGVQAQKVEVRGDVPMDEVHIGGPFLKDGAEAFWFRTAPPHDAGGVDLNMSVTARVTLDESVDEWVRQWEVTSLIAKLRDAVSDTLRGLGEATDYPSP